MKSKVILNVGRNTKDSKLHSIDAVMCALVNAGLTVHQYGVHESDTEPTIVAKVSVDTEDARGMAERVWEASNTLGQDCIAAYDITTGEGRLIGSNAKAWGKFNPDLFIMFDGSKLSAMVSPAMPDPDKIIKFENGELSREETVELFQHGIDNGWVWRLQGYYGRAARELIRAGLCTE